MPIHITICTEMLEFISTSLHLALPLPQGVKLGSKPSWEGKPTTGWHSVQGSKNTWESHIP